MPTYSYKCPTCGHEYSKRQKISHSTRARCPRCGTRGERVITGGGGLIFKGSGFYITDYKRAGEKPSAGAEKPETPATSKPKSEPSESGTPKESTPKSKGADS